MGQLMDGWKKWEELQMKSDMMMANINMQREILEIHKEMWDKHNNKNQMEVKHPKHPKAGKSTIGRYFILSYYRYHRREGL
jgi:hypothetical protein